MIFTGREKSFWQDHLDFVVSLHYLKLVTCCIWTLPALQDQHYKFSITSSALQAPIKLNPRVVEHPQFFTIHFMNRRLARPDQSEQLELEHISRNSHHPNVCAARELMRGSSCVPADREPQHLLNITLAALTQTGHYDKALLFYAVLKNAAVESRHVEQGVSQLRPFRPRKSDVSEDPSTGWNKLKRRQIQLIEFNEKS
ncbi:hypothetical protein SELMODRAFT_413756 [Selaginella moellendorffii]|uniref:Uncharacterized protein n=1 Tax=Selaginella moellendorffii TaxID=88036 RepID=D8RQ44_SELML|nr:hypothetical protein SELMODRAFT_413756 [Selaginella moellendorffii]